MTRTDVAVTGLGLLTPAGVGVAATWERVCAGLPTAAPDPELADVPVPFSCRVPAFDPRAVIGPQVWRMDRFVHLAIAAALEAVADARLGPGAWDGARVGVVVGVGSDSKETCLRSGERFLNHDYEGVSPLTVPRGTVNAAAGEIGIALQALGPSLVVSTACASGATALGVARDLLLARRCDVVLAGGAEAPCHPFNSVCFSRMGALSTRVHDPAGASRPFDADRDGFVLAEGAGILVMERPEDARARRAPVHALLAGYGASTDGHHYAAAHPKGAGVERACDAALADAGIGYADVDHINAHGTSTPMNDRIEGETLHRLFGGHPPAVTSTKGVTGHTLGAAGAIEAALSVLTLQDQVIPPTANLDRLDPRIELDVVAKVPRPARLDVVASNSFGFGGHNAVLIMRRA
ncbi:beta-ketoacyl synthase [Streptomyces sp. ISL-11]|uniref:beta-ketoacyl-[acyl-carrier-protein] synthase family protein n=1 Tax=Streptomyces sp. ISL-11 TaxID=2819174 RepID=UPI001BE6D7E0|nr:beta-ketoacyl-[acyl-carrier-protein] synthase family protein [Streptomyces sp. ISL-11]MBT2383309.1 beta-ketoacyl-[acyl-carrier-protein] synthase family protein [Streptomyces sp. ISL-11]